MALNLELNINSLMRNLKSRNTIGMHGRNSDLSAYKYATIILVITLAMLALYAFFIYIPLQKQNLAKKDELNKILNMKNQLGSLENQINTFKSKLDKSKEHYLESLARFGNSDDLGGLYQTVSILANKYDITVLNVKEIPADKNKDKDKSKSKDVKKDDGKAKTDKKEGDKTSSAEKPKTDKKTETATKKPAVEIKEIRVELEVKGEYVEYIKFKEDLSIAEILLKINEETVTVKDEKTDQGNIYAKLNLSTYAIDKKPFEGVIIAKENDAEQSDTEDADSVKQPTILNDIKTNAEQTHEKNIIDKP